MKITVKQSYGVITLPEASVTLRDEQREGGALVEFSSMPDGSGMLMTSPLVWYEDDEDGERILAPDVTASRFVDLTADEVRALTEFLVGRAGTPGKEEA